MPEKVEHLKHFYRKRIEASLVVTLAIIIIFFQVTPKIIKREPYELPPVNFTFQIEDIPATRQRYGRRPPPRPVVPVPSEDPDLPDDYTIDETIFDWKAGDSPEGIMGVTSGRQDTIPARPVVQVLPEYPKTLQKQGIKGIVKALLWVNEEGTVEEVVISENTTGSEDCADLAEQAAKKNSYLPARIGNKKVASWVSCIYTFKPE